ncbi:putative Zinc finger protein-like 1 [Helianthus annuus]|nr:putative Zinc finger protein-like 1 [Helianthus annuus]KAJ0763204.1 putative Zinc finger protein-like 1 [Helianthus annuus]
MIGPQSVVIVKPCFKKMVLLKQRAWAAACVCYSAFDKHASFICTNLTTLYCISSDVIHTSCLVSNIKSYPPHTAPSGYVCPACSTPIWPPKSVKDSGSRLHSQLKEAIVQVNSILNKYMFSTGIEKNVFGNNPVSLTVRIPPEPSVTNDDAANGSAKRSSTDNVEIDVPSSVNHLRSPTSSATTRKSAPQVERQNSEVSYFADDEDANRKKYSRRGEIIIVFKSQI